MRNMYRKKGFTLIELLVVIIIVGILVAVSIPILKGYQMRAMLTEGVAALGAIRTGQRLFFTEYDEYETPGWINEGVELAGMITREEGEDYGTSDLDGTYFAQESYFVSAPYAYVTSGYRTTDAPRESDVIRLLGAGLRWIRINLATGKIEHADIPDSGYSSWD